MASLRFGVFELDLLEGELRREGLPVKLQPQPVKVLALLASRPGQTVTREELQAEVWGNSTFVDFDRGLNFCVLQIRNALGDDADNPRFVQTVPRRGYRFIAPVERVDDASVVAPASTTPLATTPPPSREFATLVPRALVAIGLVFALMAAALWTSRRRPAAAPGASQPARVMLAVLPFENLSGDASQAFFADGLTEELITHLGRIDPDGLGVIARTSVMKYRAGVKDVGQIGRELGVSHVLEGSVRREKDRVRVTAQLIRASDQTHLWAESYDRTLVEALGLQEELARRVAASLQARLLASGAPVSRPSTLDPRAYEAFLEGRALAAQRSPDALEQALKRFDEARARDPRYAAAHAAAADALFQLRLRGRTPSQVLPQARAAAEQALALDPASAEALTVLGSVALWHAWDPAAALLLLQRALRANPSFAPAHHDLAWVLIAARRPDEAVAAIRRAQELDPLSPRASIDVGWVLLRARRYDEAVAQARKTLALEPRMSEAVACLAEGLLALGRRREAIELTRRLMQDAGAAPEELPRLDAKDARAALRAAGEWRLARMLARPGGPSSWQNVAMEQVLLGRNDDAIASLEKALLAHEMALVVVDSLPAFDRLKPDPRFQALLGKIRSKSS